MPPCNCHHPFPRPEPFSPLPRPGKVPDWGKWIRDRLAEKGALLAFPSVTAFPDPGAGPNLYLAEDTDIVYRWDGAHYQVVFDPENASDVLEYEDRGHFPETGHHGKLYIAADTGSLYRWDDTDYAELLPSKADKAVPQASGNFAALTQDGNLADSGAKPADFVGKAALFDNPDTSPTVKSSLLPSYVDDVVEYASLSAFPQPGETGKIYVALDTNKTYRWSGTQYTEIAKPTLDSDVTKNSANGVKSSGIWSALWGTATTAFSSLYDWVVAQLVHKRDYTDRSYNTQVTVNAPALHATLTSRGTQILEYYLPCTEDIPATPKINHVYTWRRDGAEFYITQGVSVYSTVWILYGSGGEQLATTTTDNTTDGWFPNLTFVVSANSEVTTTKVNSYPAEIHDTLALNSDIPTSLPWSAITGKPQSFAPSAHASTHASNGSDPITPSAIGALGNSGAQRITNGSLKVVGGNISLDGTHKFMLDEGVGIGLVLDGNRVVGISFGDGAAKNVVLPLNGEDTIAFLSNIGILAFDPTATYAVGAKVVYSNAVWNCTTAVSTAGAWTGATNWTKLFDLAVDSTPTANSNSLMTSGAIKTALDGKANCASNPTAGNLATLDSNGNPTDSGLPKDDIESLLFAQYYPDGSVKSAAEFTAGIKYDDPDTTNRTITVKPFCNTGTAANDNSGLVGRVVIPPFVDASGNGYISDDGTKFKVVGVSGDSAYDANTNLTTIIAPTTVTTIGYGAFRVCTQMTSVSLSGATTIRDTVFLNCERLTTVSLPAATRVGESAFSGCTSLAVVEFGDTPRSSVPTLGDDAFNAVPSTCQIVVPYTQYDAWKAADVWKDLMQEFVRHAEKAGKPATFTAGNLAKFDANGNPVDSGKKPSDFQSALSNGQLANIAAVSDALAFDATHSYAAGDPVVYDGTLYTFTATHTGAWIGSDVSEVDIIARLAGKLDKSGGTVTGALQIGNNSSENIILNPTNATITTEFIKNNYSSDRCFVPNGPGTLALTAGPNHTGNLAALDANGNPTDSGVKASDKLDASSASAPFSSDSSTQYAVGSHVTYNGKLYKCTTATTGGAWTGSANWTAEPMTDALRYDCITITTGQLQDHATQKVKLNAATTILTLPALTNPTDKVSDFGIDMINGYAPEENGTPTAASFQLDGMLGTDYNLIVPDGETWSEMTALAPNEMAVYYFTLSAFWINDKPTWEVMKKVVTLVPVPPAP